MQTFSCASPPHSQNFFPHETSLFKTALTTPSQPLLPTILAGTTLLRTYRCPHSSLYKLHSSTAIILFGFLTLEEGTNRLYQTGGKKLPLYTVQKPRRVQSSSILWWEPEITHQFGGHTTDTATVLFCDSLYQHIWWYQQTSCQFPSSSWFLLPSYTITSLFLSQPGNLA